MHRTHLKIPILLAVLFILSLFSTPVIGGETSDDSFNLSPVLSTNSDLSPDQQLVGAETVLNDIPSYLMALRNSSDSWNFGSTNLDSTVYTGYSGGLAGVVSALVDYYGTETDLITQESRDLALDLAQEIGNYLTTLAVTNGSGMFWNISLSDDIVDPGFDFGQAGIAYAFAQLFNVTEVASYQTTAREAFKAISSLVEPGVGLNWSTQLINKVKDLTWYPDFSLPFFSQEVYVLNNEPPSFTGKGLGTLGVAESALSLIKLLTITDENALEFQLMNSSLYWLHSQFNEVGNEISMSISEPSIGIESTTKAMGLSGMVDFLLNLHDFTQNDTYRDWATGMVHWLNGTDSGINKLHYSSYINGSVSTNVIVGDYHGVTGNLDSLNKYLDYPGTVDFSNRLQSLLFATHNFGLESDDYYEYPKFSLGGNLFDLGDVGYTTGSGGILPIVSNISSSLSITSLDSDIDKAKSYVYSQVGSDLGYSVLLPVGQSTPEINPSVGFLRSVSALLVPIKGQLEITTDTVDFGNRELPTSTSLSLPISNIGDEDITASWTGLSSSEVFIVGSFSTTISPRSTYNLFISFIPEAEAEYIEEFTILSGSGEEYNVTLTGTAYDRPQIELTNVPANNSVIDSRGSVPFSITVNDSSDITSVTFAVNGTERSMASLGDDVFESNWDTSSIQNGTYVITLEATDALGFSSEVTLIYSAEIYDPSLQERIFSPNTLLILGIATLVVIIIAIFVTRRIMN